MLNISKEDSKYIQKDRVKLIFIIILIFSFYLMQKKTRSIIIEVDVSKIKGKGRGPITLQKGFNKILPYNSKKCKFVKAQKIEPTKRNKVDFFFISLPSISESEFEQWKRFNRANSLLLGPTFIPKLWFKFPISTIWKEKNIRDILKYSKGIVVHSRRVRDYLAKKSNTTDLVNKFIILRPCTYIMPKDIKPFKDRKIDIILYEKYADSNRTRQGNQLYNLLKDTDKTIERLVYSKYNIEYALKLANNSKFIIYFSFYDTGAIALKEIQNYGLLIFTHQIDLLINNKTGFYIPELEYNDMKVAFYRIMGIINDISKEVPNTQLIANINQNINKCEKALDDLCSGIIRD